MLSNVPLINLFSVPSSPLLPPLICPHLLFISHSISLLLPVPAMITSHPNTTMAKKGHVKELNCTARGEWPIIIRWERGDTVIDPDRNPRYSITTSPNEKTDEVLSTLKVRNTLSSNIFMNITQLCIVILLSHGSHRSTSAAC